MNAQTWTRVGSAPQPYVITLREDGRLSCDCRGWTVKRAGKGRSCKHTKEIAATFAVVDTRDDAEYVIESDRKIADAPVQAVIRAALIEGAQYRPLMLADKMPDDRTFADYRAPEWAMEQKFDGERCLIAVRSGQVSAWSRAGRNAEGDRRDGLRRDLAPQIIAAAAQLPDGDYDGEVVVGIGLSSDVRRIENRAATVLVLFDMLARSGHDLTVQTYDARRAYLAEAVAVLPANAAIRMSTSSDPHAKMLAAIWAAGGEGVVLKRRSSTYAGRRSADWIKVKHHDELVAEIIGFEDSKANGAKDAVILYAFQHATLGRIESKCKVLNAGWSRRIKAGTIAVGTRIEVSYQLLMPSGKPRHGMAKRVVGEA